jgi:hypothetical protein
LRIPLRRFGVFLHHAYAFDDQTICLAEDLKHPAPLSLLVATDDFYRISLSEVHFTALASFQVAEISGGIQVRNAMSGQGTAEE